MLSRLGLGLVPAMDGVPTLEGTLEGDCAPFRCAAAFAATAFANLSCKRVLDGFEVVFRDGTAHKPVSHWLEQYRSEMLYRLL